MTTTLIPLIQQSIGENTDAQAVNARELHAFLENKDHFATWIKDRINQYDFIENQDFVTFSEFPEKGRPRIEYLLSLNMAKELSMVERNDKGKQARQYFIACEKQFQQRFRQPETAVPEDKRLRAQAMNINARTRQFNAIHKVIDKLGDKLSQPSLETLLISSAEILLETKIDYRPQIRPTFSATEIGQQLGISAAKVGKLANLHGLKTEQYGLYVLSKSQHSDRQVQTFVYYTEVLPRLRAALKP